MLKNSVNGKSFLTPKVMSLFFKSIINPSNISGSRTDHFKPKQNQLNGFGGRGPGGQNAPSRIIKHTAVGWDGVGSQIDMG